MREYGPPPTRTPPHNDRTTNSVPIRKNRSVKTRIAAYFMQCTQKQISKFVDFSFARFLNFSQDILNRIIGKKKNQNHTKIKIV